MKKIILFCFALLLLNLSSLVYSQATANADQSKIEELAIKLSKSPVYISFLTETQKLARELATNRTDYFDKEEFKKHSKEEFEKVTNDKTLSYKQKNEAFKKMGIRMGLDTNIYTPVKKASADLRKEFPELSQLSKEDSKLVYARANELMKASGYQPATTPSSDYQKVFTKTERAPTFPGGPESFRRYLERNLQKDVAAKDGAPAGLYKVKVQFIIDAEGNVSNVQAIEVPKECPSCGAEAVKVIRKGPKWQPAVQNGRNVTFKNVETISFSVAAL
jgi:hypothetical protein